MGPLLNSDLLNSMFQKYLLDEAQLHYGEFMNDLCKVIVSTRCTRAVFTCTFNFVTVHVIANIIVIVSTFYTVIQRVVCIVYVSLTERGLRSPGAVLCHVQRNVL